MGSSSANISRNMHDPRNRYATLIIQQGTVPMDADFNDGFDSLIDYLRLTLIGAAGDGSPNNGYRIVGTGATNNFTINGGNGTFEGAGLMYVGGYPVYLYSDITYTGQPATGLAGEDQRSIFPRVTGVTYDAVTNKTTITDSAANYASGELTGRSITPDIENPANVYPITANTATTIEVSGDVTANVKVGNRYRLELSTPSANRTDGVFLNVYLDEVDSTEDPNLLHSITVPSPATIESARRRRVEATIFVREDTATHGNFTSYTDSDGNAHTVVKIATINRIASDATIQASMVVDTRKLILPGGSTAPAGSVSIFAGSTAPTGWLLCDGSVLQIADFPDLFAVISNIYGGDGITTFAVPNAKGKIFVGLDSADIDFQNLGNIGGTKDSSHIHGVSIVTDSSGLHNHGNTSVPIAGGGTGEEYLLAQIGPGAHYHTLNDDGSHTHNVSGNTAGAGSANGNLQPYIVGNYIIKT